MIHTLERDFPIMMAISVCILQARPLQIDGANH